MQNVDDERVWCLQCYWCKWCIAVLAHWISRCGVFWPFFLIFYIRQTLSVNNAQLFGIGKPKKQVEPRVNWNKGQGPKEHCGEGVNWPTSKIYKGMSVYICRVLFFFSNFFHWQQKLLWLQPLEPTKKNLSRYWQEMESNTIQIIHEVHKYSTKRNPPKPIEVM